MLQVVPFVPGILQRVVQLSHQLGRFDVDGILVAEGPLLNAENEGEIFYVLRELVK